MAVAKGLLWGCYGVAMLRQKNLSWVKSLLGPLLTSAVKTDTIMA